jgi:hypothetical protein
VHNIPAETNNRGKIMKKVVKAPPTVSGALHRFIVLPFRTGPVDAQDGGVKYRFEVEGQEYAIAKFEGGLRVVDCNGGPIEGRDDHCSIMEVLHAKISELAKQQEIDATELYKQPS